MRSAHTLVVVFVLCLVFPGGFMGKKDKKDKEKKSKSSGPSNTCAVTKGVSLASFAGEKANMQVPCRYRVANFQCVLPAEVIAENTFNQDGSVYVSGATVTLTKGDKTDVASIDLEALKKAVEDGDADKPHWTTSGQALLDVAAGKTTWRLLDSFDKGAGRTVLKDGTGQFQLYLTYVDKDNDKSKKGNLTIACSASDFGGLDDADADGYCGDPSSDDKNHLKDAAADLDLSADQYLTYAALTDKTVEQTDPVCKEAVEYTSSCYYPTEAVKICGELLDAKCYARCFMKNNISPLEAYVQCVKATCRRDTRACRSLTSSLMTCPGKGKLKKYLDCGGGY